MVVSLLWAIFAFFAVSLFPIFEGRHTLASLASSIFRNRFISPLKSELVQTSGSVSPDTNSEKDAEKQRVKVEAVAEVLEE